MTHKIQGVYRAATTANQEGPGGEPNTTQGGSETVDQGEEDVDHTPRNGLTNGFHTPSEHPGRIFM